MSRYRPPQPRSKPYITPEGMVCLQRELSDLWRRRGEVTEAITAAAAEGDRSENAEYIYRKKQLREMDRRIRYLQKRIPDLKVVDQVGDNDRVYFGAYVQLENESGKEFNYRIVGADEISSDASKGYISVDSPMSKALLGKSIDDEIVLKVGESVQFLSILDIRYSAV